MIKGGLILQRNKWGFPIMRHGKHITPNIRHRVTKGVAVAPKKNFLQGLLEQIPWHPSYLFKHVNDAYDKAMGNPPQ